MIVGGAGDDDMTPSSSEDLGSWNPPDIPGATHSSPLVAVGSVVYMCGGVSTSGITADCYTLDTKILDSNWTAVAALSGGIYALSGVAIESSLWYAFRTRLYVYDTITGITTVHDMPFTDAIENCAVAYGNYSLVVGVGVNRDEIWRNDVEADPSTWSKVASLPMYMEGVSCVMFRNELYVQGGMNRSRMKLAAAFKMNLSTYELETLANLNIPRAHCQAMILNCKPAVVGGWTGQSKNLASIEVYDAVLNKWIVDKLQLQAVRRSFGLVQL